MTDPLEGLRDRGILQWSHVTHADLDALAALVIGIEYCDDPLERHDIAALAAQVPDTDPIVDAVLGRDRSGSPVAWAWNTTRCRDVNPRRVWLHGGVHPAWRDQGVGGSLIQWQLARAHQWYRQTHAVDHGPLKVIATADARLSGVRDLYVKHGLLPETWYVDLHRSIAPADADVDVCVPQGARLRPYLVAEPEAVRVAHNEAFVYDHGSRPIGPAEWDESVRRAGSRPDLSWVVQVGQRVVGYAMNSVSGDGGTQGWTDRLGVVPAWRGQGVARALLTASTSSFAKEGLADSGLGLDVAGTEPRLDLYERLGYEAVDMVVAHSACF